MLFDVDITSDIEDVMKDVDAFFYKDVPFTLATAMNKSMTDVYRRVLYSTYEKAFNVRNLSYRKNVWKLAKIITGGKYSMSFRGFKSGQVDNMFVTMYQRSDFGGGSWMEKHVEGGTKFPRGSTIAVPRNGDSMRNKGGSIRKRDKPMNITNKKDHFLMKDKGGRKRFIAKRTKGSKSLEIKYTFTPAAKIKPTFRFYADAFDTIDRTLLNHWANSMTLVISRSRFVPG